MITILTIYIIGIIAAYTTIRLIEGPSEDWREVFVKLLFSMFSWCIVVLVLFVIIPITWLEDINKKPPKWL